MLFENYILSRVTSPNAGLTNINFEKFERFADGFTDAVESTNPSDPGVNEAVSSLLNIGFEFQFDGVTYKNIVVCAAGWLALVDPSENSSLDVRNALMTSGSYENLGINLTNTTTNILLCPWFDRIKNKFDLRTVSNTNLTLFDFTTNDADRQRQGIDPPVCIVNTNNFGVRYYRDNKSSQGRRLIVRWNSISTIETFVTAATAVITFECVLYENGKIEFRYSPFVRDQLNDRLFSGSNVNNVAESATIGIFVSGSNRFRDFSFGLGLNDNRQSYKYGGQIFSSLLTDSGEKFDGSLTFHTRNYNWRLRPNANWPANNIGGTIFELKPPVTRRKVLPRLELKNQDSKSRNFSMFNDQRSVNVGSRRIVNYPAVMPRFFGGNTVESLLAQDIFSGQGDELETTGSVNSNAIQQFIAEDQEFLYVAKPFCDNQQNYAGDPFFSSSVNFEFDESLNQPLRSKKQIKFSLPVNCNTKLLGVSSSIYYFNSRIGSWTIPRNSIVNGGDIANVSPEIINGRIPEDNRGFNAVGVPLMSGSQTPAAAIGTAPSFGLSVVPGSRQMIDSLATDDYSKSIFVNANYAARKDETFSLPIDKPFLIEKIVFEIPIECGQGWFSDITTSHIPLTGSLSGSILSYDFGGPALTIALMNQVTTNNTTKREIIVSGTITHELDNISTVALSNFPPVNSNFQMRPQGFLQYGKPSAIVKQTRPGIFTGSVVVKTEALSCSGPSFAYRLSAAHPSDFDQNRSHLLSLVQSPTLSLFPGLISDTFTIVNNKPFGRNGNREISGRSIFGREFNTNQLSDLGGLGGSSIRNPFYVTGSEYQTLSSSIQLTNITRAIAMVPTVAYFSSPYLVYPKDKLVLSISKARPAIYSFEVGTGAYNTTGSVSHDVGLTTGSINITIYGSVLKEDCDTVGFSKKNLTSNIVYDVIGNDDVVDQFEVFSRGEYCDGTLDDFITGSLARKSSLNNVNIILTGSRGRVFSKFNASNQSTPDTSAAELLANPSKAFRLKPWFESVGTSTATQLVNNTERYYDSLIPDLSQCLKLNGTTIFANSATDVNTRIIPSSSQNDGVIFFNGFEAGANDKIWMRSFPFEPRYSSVSRTVNFKNFTATNALSFNINDFVTSRIFISVGTTVGGQGQLHTFADVNLTVPTLTGTLESLDTMKVMFGFGDNNMMFSGSFTGIFGTNKLPSIRNEDNMVHSIFNHKIGYSPIIRGWRHGIISAIPLFSKAYYRNGSYGQLRDCLEQRTVAKYFVVNDRTLQQRIIEGQGQSPVRVKFVDSSGATTLPANTTSQNLSFECTSSIPYVADETRNRTDVNQSILNTNLISINSDGSNNLIV